MADLKTIIHLSQEELKRQVPTQEAVLAALDTLSKREADVLQRRFGLRTGESQTLAAIGEEFGITRERVRQIEKHGIKKFVEQVSRKPLSDIVRLAESLVREHGGVIAQDKLFERFLPESQQTETSRRMLSFLIDHLPSVEPVSAAKPCRAYYALSEAHRRAVNQIIPVLAKLLENSQHQPQTSAELTRQAKEDAASEGVTYLLSEHFVEATLEIGTNFVPAPGGTWGLASWPEINPRNIREKTLYMLRREGVPMHFNEITEKIAAAKFDSKRVTTQAVHNELINGDEFVLIGRGIYALKEWGYVEGTVADVIRVVLKKADGPMERDAIIEAVLKQRHVSRNTILINLQEKSSFRRVAGHTYTIAS